VIPPSAVPRFKRVESIKALGVTISKNFSIVQHVDALLTGCAQTLFALRTLRQHGMPSMCTVLYFRLSLSTNYHMLPRRGVAMQALLIVAVWRPFSVVLFRSDADVLAPSLAHICAQADDKLFDTTA